MGTVYFVREHGRDHFKIGHTKGEVGARVRGLKKSGGPLYLQFREISTPCHLLVEKHLHSILGPKRTTGEWFGLTEVEALAAYDAGVELARRYERQGQELELLAGLTSTTSIELEPSPEIVELCDRISKMKAARAALEYELNLLENDLRMAIGPNDGVRGLATWKVVSTDRIDQARLREEKPDLFEAYLAKSFSRRLWIK
jgi:hypothetical protein